MYYVRVVAGVLFGILVFGLLDYTLPSQNTLRISNTYNRLTEIPPSAAIFWAFAIAVVLFGSSSGSAIASFDSLSNCWSDQPP